MLFRVLKQKGTLILEAGEAQGLAAGAEFDLYKDKDAVCHLRALNSKFAEVGVADAPVNLADGREQRITATIATTEEATTAVVKYCEAVG